MSKRRVQGSEFEPVQFDNLLLKPSAEQLWLDLVKETGQTPEGIGQSDHFLFVGKKRS
jgi:hypothetical protein